MLAHAQGQRLDAAQGEKTIEGRRRRAGGVLQILQTLVQWPVVQTNRAANNVGVSADVLRRRMQYQICAEIQRPLEVRRCEGVIDQTERAVPVRDFRRSPDIGDAQQRIGGRLDPQESGSPRDRPFNGPEVGRFDKRKRQAEVFEHSLEEPIGAAVNVPRGDHMIALLEQQHRGGRGAHARGESQPVLGVLQTRQRVLQRRTRGIVRPRIIVAFMHSGRALRVGAGLKYRNGDRARGRFGLLSGVNGAGGKSPSIARLFVFHLSYPPRCSTTSKRVMIPR